MAAKTENAAKPRVGAVVLNYLRDDLAAEAVQSLLDGDWQPVETAPRDGTPLLLFARASTATASIVLVGWYLTHWDWIECCFAPNSPVGIVPTHWMPLPAPPQ